MTPPVFYLTMQGREGYRHVVSVLAATVATMAGLPMRALCSRQIRDNWRTVRAWRTTAIPRAAISCPKCEQRLRALTRDGKWNQRHRARSSSLSPQSIEGET